MCLYVSVYDSIMWDSQRNVALSKKLIYHERTKHIDICSSHGEHDHHSTK